MQLDAGASWNLTVQSSTSISTFILSVRTRSSDAVLVSFGGMAFLEIQGGALVYRQKRFTQGTLNFTAITLRTHAILDDGRWHTIQLTVNNAPYTMVGVAVGVALFCFCCLI